MGETFGFAKTYADWRDLVRDPEVQVVDNCAPPNLRVDVCEEAAKLGKAILCEKPLARNTEEAYQM